MRRTRTPRIPRRILVVASRILETYVHHLDHLKTKRVAKPGKTRIYDCVQVFLSCYENDINPEVFVFSLFSTTGWDRSPGFKALLSAWAIDRFKRRETQYMAEWGNFQVDQAPEVDPNLDTTLFGEKLKGVLPPDSCIVSIREHGGYHPLSRHCQGCIVAKECAAQLERAMGVDMSRMRVIPREEAVQVLTTLFDKYPRTPLTEVRGA